MRVMLCGVRDVWMYVRAEERMGNTVESLCVGSDVVSL